MKFYFHIQLYICSFNLNKLALGDLSLGLVTRRQYTTQLNTYKPTKKNNFNKIKADILIFYY